MKCQFSGKNKKNISIFAQRVIKVKVMGCYDYNNVL